MLQDQGQVVQNVAHVNYKFISRSCLYIRVTLEWLVREGDLARMAYQYDWPSLCYARH